MTDVEILRAAERIIRHATPTTEHEREVFRDTITGLLWVRADLVIAEYSRRCPVHRLSGYHLPCPLPHH